MLCFALKYTFCVVLRVREQLIPGEVNIFMKRCTTIFSRFIFNSLLFLLTCIMKKSHLLEGLLE